MNTFVVVLPPRVHLWEGKGTWGSLGDKEGGKLFSYNKLVIFVR